MENLKKLIKIGLESMPNATAAEVAEFILTKYRPLIRDWLIAQIERDRKPRSKNPARRRGAPNRIDDPQTWLDFPEYEHVPVEVQGETLEEFDKRIKALDRKIRRYNYARVAAETEKLDKLQLKEMLLLKSRVAPMMENQPKLTVRAALDLLP